jgi:hypothetical protein
LEAGDRHKRDAICFPAFRLDLFLAEENRAGDTATLFVDNVTVKSRAENSWTVEMVENFDVDPNGFAAVHVAHDAAGNMTFDGLHSFAYDAWNRLVEVRRAYANPNDPNDPNNLLSDSVVGTIRYDGLGRRVVKQVGDGRSLTREAGDWEMTYHLYHDGVRTVEERNGSGQVIRQYVWGRTYVDESSRACNSLHAQWIRELELREPQVARLGRRLRRRLRQRAVLHL